jgi:hypothetical protein
LQRVTAEDITDPAEIAALDEAHKRYKGRQATRNRKNAKNASSSAAKKESNSR